MVRKQCFEVGCLGGSSSRSVELCFRLAVTQSCIFCGFWKKRNNLKPVLQVPTSHEIHQRALVCCLGSGREDSTTGITASLLHPEPMSRGIDQSDVKAYFTYKSQVPYRCSLCFLFGSSGGVFSQRHLLRLSVWPPWVRFSVSCRLEEWCAMTGYGVTPNSLSDLLEMRRVRRSIQEHRHGISHILKWAGACLNQCQMWEQPLWFRLGWRTRHSFQLPCSVHYR